MSSIINKQKGASLLEMVIYIAVFALLSAAIIEALFSLSHAYARVSASWTLEAVAEITLEKIAREARGSQSLDASVPGRLALTQSDGETIRILDFTLSDGIIRMSEDGLDAGPISPVGARIIGATFTSLNTGNSSAVRIELSVESGEGASLKSETFYATAVLRDSYAP